MSNLNLGQVKNDDLSNNNHSTKESGGFASVIYILGALEIIFGVILGMVLADILWLFVGISSAVLLFALAEIIRLLAQISYKLDHKSS